ncbi:MAG: reductive dehalogenase [Thermoplasmatales archaeon]|nr:MAG: reductive dehalogenase [Thermoplasmatales archaeon]
MIQEVDSPPYIIDINNLKRFDERKTVFGRMLHDEKAEYYRTGMYDEIEKVLSGNQKGYSRIEFAKVMGAWAVYDYFHKAFSWEKLNDANSIMNKPTLGKYPISDRAFMNKKIKGIAKKYGASLVGVTKINHSWIYSKDINGKTIEIPEEFRFAIVMAIRMDPTAINTSPTFTACAETAIAYSRIAFCIGCTAEFIRSLGYKAIPMGNDTALSIPLAIDAGLGELGRNGLLITPKYGPCVRLCKIFTDMSLTTDKPIVFGVNKYCKKCKKCAEACRANAIQVKEEPSFDIACPSNNPGIFRWTVNQNKCYKFWIENGGECSNCIAACPYFPINKRIKDTDEQ